MKTQRDDNQFDPNTRQRGQERVSQSDMTNSIH